MTVTAIRNDGYIETYENVESIYYSKVDGRRLVIKQKYCVDHLPCQKIISVNCCFTKDEVRELKNNKGENNYDRRKISNGDSK